MISGSFHPSAQEWRYYSREKSLIHTLHLASLSTGRSGDTVEIAAVAPPASSSSSHFSVPPLNLPAVPGGGGILDLTFNRNQLSQCFGSVGISKNILCQKNMIIQFGVWDDFLKEILFIPQQAGFFWCHVEFTSGLRGYENAPVEGNSHSFLGQGVRVTPPTPHSNFLNATSSLTMSPANPSPASWSPTLYLSSIMSAGDTEFVLSGLGTPLRMYMTNNSHPAATAEPNSHLSAWVVKIAEPG